MALTLELALAGTLLTEAIDAIHPRDTVLQQDRLPTSGVFIFLKPKALRFGSRMEKPCRLYRLFRNIFSTPITS